MFVNNLSIKSYIAALAAEWRIYMTENNAELEFTVDSVESLEKRINQVREAVKIFSTYSLLPHLQLIRQE